jgi:hypothetical protein
VGLKAALLGAIASESCVKKLAVTGDSGEPIATPSVCSWNWPLKQKEEVMRTRWKILISPRIISFKESLVGIPVKRETTSKLTRMSLGWT